MKKVELQQRQETSIFFRKKTQTGNVEFVRCEVLATLRVAKVGHLPSSMLIMIYLLNVQAYM